MKPFNLKRAIAGHELITKSGQKATFVNYNPNRDSRNQVEAMIDGNDLPYTYRKDGRYHPAFGAYPCDLFMKRSWIGEVMYKMITNGNYIQSGTNRMIY